MGRHKKTIFDESAPAKRRLSPSFTEEQYVQLRQLSTCMKWPIAKVIRYMISIAIEKYCCTLKYEPEKAIIKEKKPHTRQIDIYLRDGEFSELQDYAMRAGKQPTKFLRSVFDYYFQSPYFTKKLEEYTQQEEEGE